MKHKARYTHRLRTWAYWASPEDWRRRTVGFGHSLSEAREDWMKQTGAAAVPAANH